MGAKTMVRLHDVRFRYRQGEFVLRVPELRVERGERIAMVGPSGSGKTTLLSLIAGIATPESGRVWTADTEVSALDDAARRSFRIRNIGLVFQTFELIDYLRLLDNVLLPYRIHPALRLDTPARERARELARSVGLGGKLDRPVPQLSHGERQRIALCRALVTEPDLILADEPTANLDAANAERVLDILDEYSERHSATLITVTHDRDLLPRFQRVIDLKALGWGTESTP